MLIRGGNDREQNSSIPVVYMLQRHRESVEGIPCLFLINIMEENLPANLTKLRGKL